MPGMGFLSRLIVPVGASQPLLRSPDDTTTMARQETMQ